MTFLMVSVDMCNRVLSISQSRLLIINQSEILAMTLFIFIFMTTVKLQIKHEDKPTLNAFEAMFKFNPEVLSPYSFIYSSANISESSH